MQSAMGAGHAMRRTLAAAPRRAAAPSNVTSTLVMGRPMPGMAVLAWVNVFSLYSRICWQGRKDDRYGQVAAS